MNTLRIILILFICLPGSSFVFSQPDTSGIIPDTTDLGSTKYQEILLENTLDENEDSKLLDKIEYLKGNPVDINTAKQEDLEEIPFISRIVANRIIKYRNTNGKFKSKRQLIEIEGISQDLYDKLKPYVIARNSKTDYVKDEEGNVRLESSVKGRNLFSGADFRIRSRIQQDLQTKEGYIDGDYQGSKIKIYNRFTGNYKGADYKLGANLTLEKDAGEQKLTDFYSGYLELKDWKFIKKAVAGDYVLNFGQGLGLWTSLAFSKGSET
ncbi:MAG: helix-hairpin-helix domain-containing protein, partial [Ignavibacteria bacterium]|nr:helix-hairpin-helix domain-containing protein [Ignavibacteria bacterium]